MSGIFGVVSEGDCVHDVFFGTDYHSHYGKEKGGMAMAMFTGAFDMGLVFGAAAFGFVAEHMGYPAMFYSAAALTAAGAIFFFTQDPAFRDTASPGAGS